MIFLRFSILFLNWLNFDILITTIRFSMVQFVGIECDISKIVQLSSRTLGYPKTSSDPKTSHRNHTEWHLLDRGYRSPEVISEDPILINSVLFFLTNIYVVSYSGEYDTNTIDSYSGIVIIAKG